jgi:hypothetical protein
VECGEEVDPRKSAICVSHSREDVGNKVLAVDEPPRLEDVEDIKDRVVQVLQSRVRGHCGQRGSWGRPWQ